MTLAGVFRGPYAARHLGGGTIILDGAETMVAMAVSAQAAELLLAALNDHRPGALDAATAVPRLARIRRAAAAVCNLPETALTGARQDDAAIAARYLAAFTMRRHTGHSYSVIGRALGKRDHTTIIAAVDKGARLIAALPEWERRYKAVAELAVLDGGAEWAV